jgi:hypothetical protein
VPVLLGGGVRLFEELGSVPVKKECDAENRRRMHVWESCKIRIMQRR